MGLNLLFLSQFSLAVDLKELSFELVDHLRVRRYFLVDVHDGVKEDAELFAVDVRGQVSFGLFLFLDGFLAQTLSSLFSLAFLLLVGGLLVEALGLLFLDKAFDDLLEALLASDFLDLEPMYHDSIFELDSKLSAVLFLFVIVDYLPSLLMLEIMRLAEWVFDNVVKSRLFGIWIDQLNLKPSDCLVQLNVLLPEILDSVDMHIKHRDSSLTFSICINSIIHQE